MSSLVIVESPSKAKTVEKYLSEIGNYKVIASVGHIRDLPKSEKTAIDISNGFKPNYEVVAGKQKVIQDMKRLAATADEVLLATDLDREGEAIAWHIAEALKLSKPKRIVFNEITKEAIQRAITEPRTIDDNMKQAQEARRVLDRLFGYGLSGLVWKKVRYGLSAGRVQSPALRIIMEREREIRAFIPETFWTLTANVKKEKITFSVVCKEEPQDKKLVDTIIATAEKEDWLVVEVKETKAKRAPKAPFMTSTLQQAASTRLGYSPARTMQIAQKLYEAGHITYMRTDSTTLAAQAHGQIKKVVAKEYGADHYEYRAWQGKKSKSAQEAHEAIRPSAIGTMSAGSTTDQKELYALIWSRTVASQMVDAQTLRTKVITNVSSNSIPDFSVNGQRIIGEGWLKADPKARGEDTEVPKVAKGDSLQFITITNEEKQTQPPSRYSEAGLVKELDKREIGRPSTYASIIKTLNDRGYVEKEGRTLIPTDTGDVVSSFIEEHFTNYISDDFTAEMESDLDGIATGEKEYVKTLSDFYTPFTKDIEEKEDIPKLTTLGDADPKFKCPKCKSALDIKLGRAGKFLSCKQYPDCDGALTLEGKEIGNEKPLGMHPESNLPIFVLEGRFGPYVQLGELEKKVKLPTVKKISKDELAKMTPEQKEELKKAKLLVKEARAKERERKANAIKPKRASIPKDINPEAITLEEAVHLLILPRDLGIHPDLQEPVIANVGRFGPYVGCDGDFRSLKDTTPYDVTLEEAVTLLNEPKAPPRGAEISKELGKHPKTKKPITLYKSKSGYFLKKGLRRIYLPDSLNVDKFTLEEAIEIVKSA